MANTQRRKYTPAQLEEEIQAYFAYCRSTETQAGKAQPCHKPPTLEGLAAYLGLSKRTLQRYRQGGYAGPEAEKRRVADCMERALDCLTAETLEGALLGRYDSRICSMILQDMGYGEKAGQEQAAVLRVEWGGVSAEQLQTWSE